MTRSPRPSVRASLREVDAGVTSRGRRNGHVKDVMAAGQQWSQWRILPAAAVLRFLRIPPLPTSQVEANLIKHIVT